VAVKLSNCYKFVNNTKGAEEMFAKALSYDDFDPKYYLDYAEVLKQNGKYEEAKKNFLMYAEHFPNLANQAVAKANSCDAARLWNDKPAENIFVKNEDYLNSDNSDFSPIPYEDGYIIVSDRVFSEGESNNK